MVVHMCLKIPTIAFSICVSSSLFLKGRLQKRGKGGIFILQSASGDSYLLHSMLLKDESIDLALEPILCRMQILLDFCISDIFISSFEKAYNCYLQAEKNHLFLVRFLNEMSYPFDN